MMNTTITRATMLLLLCSLPSHAETILSTPAGFVETTLDVGFNPMGLNVHNPVVASGEFDSESGGVLTDGDVTFTNLLTETGASYLLEILSGPAAGAVAEISIITDHSVDVGAALNAGNAAYAIRKAHTLEDLFGVGEDAVLSGASTSGSADIVWVPDGSGGYVRYFYSTLRGGFRLTDDAFATVSPDTSLFYPQGLLVEIRTTPKTLRIFGEIKREPTAFAADKGFRLISVPSPVGQTLAESGLADTLTASLTSSAADIVWVPDGTGGYNRYFFSSGHSQWKSIDSAFGSDRGDTILSGSILIERKGEGTSGIFALPAFFSNL